MKMRYGNDIIEIIDKKRYQRVEISLHVRM